MKKIILLSILICCFVSNCMGWGFLSHQYEGVSLLYKIIGKKNPTINACVLTAQYDKKGKQIIYVPTKNKDIETEYINLTQMALNSWFKAARDKINSTQRANEFQDLFSLLPENIQVVKTKNCSEQGILRLIYSPNEHSTARGTACTDTTCGDQEHEVKSYTITLHETIPTDFKISSGFYVGSGALQKVIKHEVGHLLGLDDQYGLALNGLFGTFDRNPDAIMGYANTGGNFTEDDVDGIINAIDFVHAYTNPTQISARVQNGWKGFKSGVYYNYMQSYSKGTDEVVQRMHNQQTWNSFISLKQDLISLGKYALNLSKEKNTLSSQKKEDIPISVQRGELTKQQINTMMTEAKIRYVEDIEEELSQLNDQLEDALTKCPANSSCNFDKITQLVNAYKQKNPHIPAVYYDAEKLNKTKTTMLIEKRPICAICEQPIAFDSDGGIGQISTKKGGKVVSTRYYYTHQHCNATDQKPKEKYISRKKLQPWEYYYLLSYGELAKDLYKIENNVSDNNLAYNVKNGVQTSGKAEFVQPTLEKNTFYGVPPDSRELEFTKDENGNKIVATKEKALTNKKETTKVATATSTSLDVSPIPQTKDEGKKPLTSATSTERKSIKKPSASNVPVNKKKIGKCEICGKEIYKGEAYYQRTSSHYVHVGNECAYRMFAKFSKVDNDSLTRYQDYYFLKVPEDVYKAKSLMKKLHLSIPDIRKYRDQIEAQETEQKRKLEIAKELQNLQNKYDKECALVVNVSSEDVASYAQENAKVLARISKKRRENKALTNKESRINSSYEQLKANRETKINCDTLKGKIDDLKMQSY